MMANHLTCFGVEHQDIGPRSQQLLEVLVIADLLYQRGHLHRLQHRRQPHLVEAHNRSGHQRHRDRHLHLRSQMGAKEPNQINVSGSR